MSIGSRMPLNSERLEGTKYFLGNTNSSPLPSSLILSTGSNEMHAQFRYTVNVVKCLLN